MRNNFYAIQILVDGEWVVAKTGNMSKSAAEGLFAGFAQQYSAMLFRGHPETKLVKKSIK